MNEAGKHAVRRAQRGYFDRYIVGQGIDIGCGTHPFHKSAIGYDTLISPEQRADLALPFPDNHFDYVHSSHCLEHMPNPNTTLWEWWRILKPNGHMIILAPDFGLYEQRRWPSHYNHDHKTYWSLTKLIQAINILPGAEIVEAHRNSDNYDFTPKFYDRTLGPALADIEVIALKTTADYMFSSRIS